jgi:hemerythrin superfamily protein
MAATASPGKVVDLLQEDHEQVKALFGQLTSSPPEARKDLFCHLVTELVRHEVAEEVVVYPAIRSDAPDGSAEVKPRLQEQSEAEQKLAKMEKLDPTTPEFASELAELRAAVLAHAQAEEMNIFPLLRALEGDEKLLEMGAKYERAKSSAPTHPHPHAPNTPPGNKILGPIAALFDKARDAARKS